MRHPTHPAPSSNVVRLADFRAPGRHPRADTTRAPDGDRPRTARERARSGAAAGPVRVTHLQPGASRMGAAAHLRISGRLVDVCAALDRLIEAEARAPATPQRRA